MAPSTRRHLRTTAIVLGGLFGAAVIVIGAIFVNFYSETRHPAEARPCECDLLEQWVANLPLTPQGDQILQQDVTVNEGPSAFGIVTSGVAPGGFGRESLLEALTNAGFSQSEGRNTDELWSASFSPGEPYGDNPWRMTVTSAEGEIGISVGVTVDGSPWGLETNEDLHDFYRDHLEAALATQEQRQQQAIEILAPLQQALEAMTDNG